MNWPELGITVRLTVMSLVLTLVAAGCAAGDALAPGTTSNDPLAGANSACLLLIDRTSSSESPEVVDNYRTFASATIEGCADLSGAIMIGYFDQGRDSYRLVGWFGLNPQAASVNRQDRLRRQAEKDASEAVDALFQQAGTPTSGSDIIVALNEATKTFREATDTAGIQDRYVVLLTDGLQYSDAITLENLQPDTSMTTFIDQARKLNLLPGLSGMQVSVAGVRSNKLPSWFENEVERFWDALVETAGGRVCWYGAIPGSLPASC